MTFVFVFFCVLEYKFMYEGILSAIIVQTYFLLLNKAAPALNAQ